MRLLHTTRLMRRTSPTEQGLMLPLAICGATQLCHLALLICQLIFEWEFLMHMLTMKQQAIHFYKYSNLSNMDLNLCNDLH